MHHAEYYSVAATVIPVLFLAATLQAKGFRANIALVEWDLRRVRRHHPDRTDAEDNRYRRTFKRGIAVIAIVPLAIGFAGEFLALTNLNDLTDTRADREFIMYALSLLAIVVGIGIAVEVVTNIVTGPGTPRNDSPASS